MLPDTTITTRISIKIDRLNAPTGAWCSLTHLCPGGGVRILPRLNAPTGAWCSLTGAIPAGYAGCRWGLNAPTGAWCSLTIMKKAIDIVVYVVSMHLQVRGAP